MKPLYLPVCIELSFCLKVKDLVRWADWSCHTSRQVWEPIFHHKICWEDLKFSPIETFAVVNLIQTLSSMIFLRRASLLLCARDGICALHPCPHIDAQTAGCWVHEVDHFNHCISWNTLWRAGDIFRLASTSLWMTSHSGATSLIRTVKPDSLPIMAAAPSVHTSTQKD